MNTLTKKDKLALQVSLALVAGMFSLVPVVQGAPVLDKVVRGGATVVEGTTTTVDSSNLNNIIKWKDFSVAGGDNGTTRESVIFDGGAKTNNYLNVVTGNGTSYINGDIKGGNNVYVVNPNGVIMGQKAQIDVGNLYVSTKDLTNIDDLAAGTTTLEGASILEGTVNEEVVNMGKIQANSVYAEGTNIRFVNTAKVTSDGSTPLGNVTLNASGYVHVGYEATAESTTAASGTNGQYAASNIDTSKTAKGLGYKVTSSNDDIDYALVRNRVELQNMNSNKSLNYMLYNEAGNITLSGTFTPIGDGNNPFTGNFDGNFHTINGLTNTSASNNYTGLFGYVKGNSDTNRSNIMNVGVVDVTLLSKAGGYVGGIAGYIENVNLENVYNRTTASSGKYVSAYLSSFVGPNNTSYTYSDDKVGGIVGYAKNSSIKNVYNNCEVTNGAGLIGKLEKSELKNAYNSGLIYTNRDFVYGTSTLDQHYAIVDVRDSSSTVKNVYGSGSYQKRDKSSTITDTSLSLAPSTTNFTNAYVIDSSSKQIVNAYGDTSSANYMNNNSSYSKNVSGMSADNFGFFESTQSEDTYIASTKSSDGTWRIYEGHTLPLLRSFLKANGNGTVPVSYTYNLYANAQGGEAVKTLKGSNSNGTVTYNGYYIGIDDVQTDKVRGLNKNYIKPADTTARQKDVGKTISAFYSTGQDGYDLAGDTLRIEHRNLAPSGNLTNIDKVYDGTSDATAAMGDNLLQKIDLRDYEEDPGYGIVEVYATISASEPVRVDDVAINAGTTDSDGNLIPGTGFVKSATYDDGPDVVNDSNITFEFGDVDALTGEDAGNYVLKKSDFTNVKMSGDITQRPIYVSLKDAATSRDKIYDGTSHIVNNSTTTETLDDSGNVVEVVHTLNDIDVKTKSDIADSGLTGNDGVSVVLSDAYYANNGTKVASANKATDTTSYDAVYKLALAAGDAGKISNYVLKDASTKEVLTNNSLVGTGKINQRDVSLTDVSILDASNEVIQKATKTYDYTSAYDGAKGVTFSVGGGVKEGAAVNQTTTEGVLAADADKFNFSLGSAEFYTGDSDSDTAAKTVSTAKKVKYLLTPDDPDTLKNYTINGNEIKNEGVAHYGEGEITKRAVTIDMVTNSGIDKYYDGSEAVKNTVNVDGNGYLHFNGTNATVTHTANNAYADAAGANAKGYVGYKSTDGTHLVADDYAGVNDGTKINIDAVYTTEGADGVVGATTNAQDVYYNADAPANGKDKVITYTVTLHGENADNYTLNGEEATSTAAGGNATVIGPSAELSATGAIDPRKITGITFGDVTKSYDGSSAVGEVNGVTQTDNQITIGGVTIDTSDGVTANSSGLIGSDTYDAVLGTTGGVLKDSSTISGTYGTPGWTIASTDAFQGDAHAHNGADRKVQYTGVSSITSDNHNYTTVGMDDTQYGDGTIKPLKIDTLSASGDGNITKVYDGTTNVVGGYRVQYEISTSTNPGQESDIVGTLVKHQNDASDVKTALGTITGTGTGVDGTSKVSVDFGGSAYTVDEANTVYNSTHVNEANKITYAVNLDNTNGDYVLAASADATNSGYISYGTAGTGVKIDKTGSGLITARNVYTQGVTGLSKTYDGDTNVKNSGGTVLTGDSVVTFNAKDNYSGLTGNDNVTNVSTAAYSGDTRTNYDAKDANVYKDGVQTTAEGAKYVTYTVKLSDNSHGDYVIYKNTNGDSYYAPGSEYTLSGNNITQADLKVSFGDVSKNYDTNAKVVGAVSESTDAVVNGTKTGDTVAFATKDTSAFLAGTTENPSAAAADVGTHQVQYDLVSTSADLKNYRLVGSDGTTALSVSKNNDGSYNVTAYGKGTISPLTIQSITAAIDAVTKVYDGTAALTYDHNAAGGYDSTQVGSASSSDSVHSINLGGLALQENTGKYTVNDDSITIGGNSIAGTQFADSNAGNGKSITYRITINKDVVKNLTIDADAVQNADSSIKVYKNEDTGEYVITKTTNDNTIKAKNAYAYLNSNGLAAGPSKVYDGNTNAVSADTAKSYVTVNGLAGGDGYTVGSAYESKDVAVENGQAAKSKNNIDYTVALGNNYNLYTVDETGNIFTHDGNHATADTGYNYDKETGHLTKDTAPAAVLDTTNDMSALVANPTKVLVGTGTITPKEITFDATLAQKTYDANADVKLSATETGDAVPVFTLSGLVAAGDLTVATTGDNAISGKYGNYADGAFTADANVALAADGTTPTSKAVQYSGILASLTAGNSAVTNYKLVGSSDANSLYNAADDTWTFLAGANKGLITKRGISQITSKWGNITKEYDATSSVLNPTEGFKVYGVSNVGGTETKIPISYVLDQAVYGSLNAAGDGIETTYKDVGGDLGVVYQISGLSADEMQNFTLDSSISTAGYTGYQTGTGSITQRVISGKATDAVQDKVYGQDYGTGNLAAALSNGTYFNIDSDDLEVLNKDGKDSTALTVSGVYADKNANHDPGETATSHKDVNFTIGWAANQTDTGYQSNYTFDTNNGTGSDYIGKGDIQKRIVYVKDNGGTVQEKTYDGSPALASAIPSDKFTLNVASGGNTGVIAGDNVTLDSDAITGAYASKDVARDSSGKVVNKAVNYSGFALKDGDSTDDTGNYYLMADSGINSVALTNSEGETVNSALTYANDATTGALTITEKQGGLIKPKEVTISIASPEKTYDATTDVETADMAGSNLTAKADGQDVSKHFDSANNAVFELHPGTGQDDVTVEITGASYDTKDVSYDENGKGNKVTTFNISWHNGNYDFVSETEENGDTFEEKFYSASNGKVNRTGELKDHTSTINPLELHISSMNATKTYDGNPYYSYTGSGSSNGLTVSFGDAADAVIQKDINMSDNTAVNNVGFLGLTVSKGTYQEATEAAKTAAAKAGVSQEDIDAGLATDAAFDEKSGSFQHGVNFSGIALDSSNANYKNYKLMDDSFNYSESGTDTKNTKSTGTIERATVTAHASNGEMYTESRLPSFSGRLTGFLPGDTTTIQVPVTTVTVDESGNEVEETTYVPKEVSWEEYYKSYFSWGPDSNIDTSKVGSYPVYGWYRKTVDGAEGLYKSSNLGKNYVLAQDPGTLTLTRYYASDSSGGSGGYNGKSSATTVVLQPASSAPVAKTETAAANNVVPAPVVEALTTGYVEKPTTPDSSVYQNVSKDNSNTGSHEGKASIQYGDSTTTLDSSDGSSSGTIGIEVAEVVNLLGGDVASDGTMSLTNTGDGQALSVESTENGYLSVGSAGSEGSIGIETEGGIVSADNGEREGTIGLETEGSLLNADNGEKEGTISLETEEGVLNANGTDKEGTIGLETEDEVLLDTEQGKELLSTTSSDEESGTTKEGSISIRSSSKDGEAEITSAGSRLAKADEVQEKDEDKDKEDEEEKDSEEESNKEGEAAIAYSDVA